MTPFEQLIAVLEAPKPTGGHVGGNCVRAGREHGGENRLLPARWGAPYDVYASTDQPHPSILDSEAEHAAGHAEREKLGMGDQPVLPGCELSDESIHTHDGHIGSRV